MEEYKEYTIIELAKNNPIQFYQSTIDGLLDIIDEDKLRIHILLYMSLILHSKRELSDEEDQHFTEYLNALVDYYEINSMKHLSRTIKYLEQKKSYYHLDTLQPIGDIQ